jgi:hypothetical protein
VLSATPAAAIPLSPAVGVPPVAGSFSGVREQAVAPTAPGVRIATDDRAAAARPGLDQLADTAGDLGPEPASAEVKTRSGKPAKLKPKRAARRPATASERGREPLSPTPPVRSAPPQSPESPGSALSVDGRRIRTTLTPNP